ncbi:hypothetical protein AG1IA_06612 [Rhizoctonia solani AG-1 IA]|uniref:Uncharacterized protein n=1 Tax=Thanatephorus cucumeris (strain AG1-IA) TaxID=983506 RepID=L8WRJ4_THACA|nr:hypothetical protein AG1IA_06612 [Rhizoctonia solani AG-1 IA]
MITGRSHKLKPINDRASAKFANCGKRWGLAGRTSQATSSLDSDNIQSGAKDKLKSRHNKTNNPLGSFSFF